MVTKSLDDGGPGLSLPMRHLRMEYHYGEVEAARGRHTTVDFMAKKPVTVPVQVKFRAEDKE